MNTLKLLEKAIDELAYVRAMRKIKDKKSIKTWGRLGKKMRQFIKEETEIIIQRIMNII